MKYRALRHIASLLLAVYLPMVVGSSLHVHHDTVDAHDDCLQCAGHIDTHHRHQQDCQYCLFLGLAYLGRSYGHPEVIRPATERCAAEVVMRPVLPPCGAVRLRAPPSAGSLQA